MKVFPDTRYKIIYLSKSYIYFIDAFLLVPQAFSIFEVFP